MTASYDSAAERRDGVSFPRLLWVGPLTVVVALLVNLAIKTLLQALDPSLAEMGQLGRPLVILTLEGAILAVLVFALMVWLVPHPIRWFRLVAVIALLLSLIPDLLLGFGGIYGAPARRWWRPSRASGRSSFPRRRVADHRPV